MKWGYSIIYCGILTSQLTKFIIYQILRVKNSKAKYNEETRYIVIQMWLVMEPFSGLVH